MRTYSSNGDDSSESTPVTYHVIFQNYDGTLLYECDVEEGCEAIYGGETPVKMSDDEYIYTFKGWDKDLSEIRSDLTTNAVYDVELNGEGWSPIHWFE